MAKNGAKTKTKSDEIPACKNVNLKAVRSASSAGLGSEDAPRLRESTMLIMSGRKAAKTSMVTTSQTPIGGFGFQRSNLFEFPFAIPESNFPD
jgi:hypothetical protein